MGWLPAPKPCFPQAAHSQWPSTTWSQEWESAHSCPMRDSSKRHLYSGTPSSWLRLSQNCATVRIPPYPILTSVLSQVSNLHCDLKTLLVYSCSPPCFPLIFTSISPSEALVHLIPCWLLLRESELTLLSTGCDLKNNGYIMHDKSISGVAWITISWGLLRPSLSSRKVCYDWLLMSAMGTKGDGKAHVPCICSSWLLQATWTSLPRLFDVIKLERL